MKFNWNVTIDILTESNGQAYNDDEELMNRAILDFEKAQEAFFSSLDGSSSYSYNCVKDESK
jgi:hypothetical protein